MKNKFERKEIKFLLKKSQKEQFLFRLQEALLYDQFPDYWIYSVYYDTEQMDLIARSVSKPVYKEKLRMRSYQEAISENSPVFLEVKKKYQGVVYKRRKDFTLSEALSFLKNPKADDVTSGELKNLIDSSSLNPAISLYYHREAFVWKGIPDLRITFDDTVCFRKEDHGLFRSEADQPLIDPDLCILEIKARFALPKMLVRTLSEMGLVSGSISKAGLVFKQSLLQKGNQKQCQIL